MANLIYKNGKRVHQELPLRSLLFGEGVFETFRYKSSLPLHFEKHLKRLKEGAKFLSMDMPDEAELIALVHKAVNKSGLNDLYVKLCLLSEGLNPFYERSDGTQVLIQIKDYQNPKQSLKVIFSGIRKSSSSPVLKHKTFNYTENIIARRQAIEQGYDETLFLNENGHITEGSAGNIFWYRDDILYSPEIQCGLLPGTIRHILIESKSDIGLKIEEGKFTKDDILSADFMFFTNSIAGITPIELLEGKTFPLDHKVFLTLKEFINTKLGWI